MVPGLGGGGNRYLGCEGTSVIRGGRADLDGVGVQSEAHRRGGSEARARHGDTLTGLDGLGATVMVGVESFSDSTVTAATVASLPKPLSAYAGLS